MSTGSILYHQNHKSINTFNTNLTPGCVNPYVECLINNK